MIATENDNTNGERESFAQARSIMSTAKTATSSTKSTPNLTPVAPPVAPIPEAKDTKEPASANKELIVLMAKLAAFAPKEFNLLERADFKKFSAATLTSLRKACNREHHARVVEEEDKRIPSQTKVRILKGARQEELVGTVAMVMTPKKKGAHVMPAEWKRMNQPFIEYEYLEVIEEEDAS